MACHQARHVKMLLVATGDGFPGRLFEEVQLLTDHAILFIDTVDYDEANGSLSFVISRCPVRLAPRFFGALTTPLYDTQRRVASRITLANVLECRMENLVPNGVSQVTLERGVIVSDRRVVVCAQEEDK